MSIDLEMIEKEADEIIKEARKKAKEIIAKPLPLDKFKEEAEKIIEDAKNRANEIIKEAETQAEQIRIKANKNLDKATKELLKYVVGAG